MMKRPDHELLLLGGAFSDANKRLGATDLTEIERFELSEKWFSILSAMCSVEAKTRTGLRIKAAAVITAYARTGDIHDVAPRKISLSLAGDTLTMSKL